MQSQTDEHVITPYPIPSSSRRANLEVNPHLSPFPTPNAGPSALSTGAADVLRDSYFPSTDIKALRSSVSYVDQTRSLHTRISKPGNKRKLSLPTKSRDDEWTVFRELFEDQHAPFFDEFARPQRRDTKRSTSGVARADGQEPPIIRRRNTNASRVTRVEEEQTDSPEHARLPIPQPDTAQDSLSELASNIESRLRDPTPNTAHRGSNASASPASTTPRTETARYIPRFYDRITSLYTKKPHLATLHRNILKCAIAYLIASLFTFVPSLSRYVSDISTGVRGKGIPSPSAHMIATVSVYFNPAKTAGAMFEADVFCLMGVALSAVVTCASALGNLIDARVPSIDWLGDLIILSWIAAAIMAISWTKIRLDKPSFGTAASMTSIIMFIVIVVEGGFFVLGQVVVNVAIGVSISNFICFALWPQSAAANLRRNMITSMDSYATILDMLTSSFLLDAGSKRMVQVMQAIEAHQNGFTKLKSNLDEARSEWILNPPDAPNSSNHRQGLSHLYGEAVDSFNRLAQHLAGLRSGTKLQKDVTVLHRSQGMGHGFSKRSTTTEVPDGITPEDEDIEHEMRDEGASLASATLVFGDLLREIRSPMRALTDTCVNTLKAICKSLDQQQQNGANYHNSMEHEEGLEELGSLINRALLLFDSTSDQILMSIYKQSGYGDTTSITSDSSQQGDENEIIFVVYFFIFTLEEFAQELSLLTNIMGQINEAHRAGLASRGILNWLRRVFSFKYRSSSHGSIEAQNNDWNRDNTTKKTTGRKNKPRLLRKFSGLVPMEPAQPRHYGFPLIRAHAPNTINTPARSSLSFSGRMQWTLWYISRKLKDNDLRFSLKVGVSTAILAAPAFIDATRPTFVEYRGEWALISFFVVIGKTIGATNALALHRIMGTIFGAWIAAIAFTLLSPFPVLLAIFGFVFSLPCFYYIAGAPRYAVTGRFVLLSYNLTALFCYNSRLQHLPVYRVAFHRSVAVATGVLWALVVSRVWWPSEARRELSVGLSEFFLNLGWLYNRLGLTYSLPPKALARRAAANLPYSDSSAPLIDEDADDASERDSLLGPAMIRGLNTSIRDFMGMELHLQIKLITLQRLLSQAQNEPRLKGPFPVQLYRRILTSLQVILDLLHSMRSVTTREEWYTTVRRDFIVPVHAQRRELVGSILLFFSVLSAAFQLKAPLPPYLPPAERSRQRLVNAMRDLPIFKEKKVQNSRQLLYFAYAIMMEGVIAELETLGEILQDAFGVIGQSKEEFESLFQPQFPRHNEEEFIGVDD